MPGPYDPTKAGKVIIMAHKPEELQEVLHYTFKNPALLRIALTHTSFANESKVDVYKRQQYFLSFISYLLSKILFH